MKYYFIYLQNHIWYKVKKIELLQDENVLKRKTIWKSTFQITNTWIPDWIFLMSMPNYNVNYKLLEEKLPNENIVPTSVYLLFKKYVFLFFPC